MESVVLDKKPKGILNNKLCYVRLLCWEGKQSPANSLVKGGVLTKLSCPIHNERM